MERLVNYFSTIPSSHRSVILLGGITFFWLIESTLPLFKFSYHKWRHAGVNIFFTITTIVVNFILAFILLKSSDWAVSNQFGIINWLPDIPLWIYAILGLLLLDFIGAWFIHWLEHKVKWMWRFHIIHHSDMQVDTTTANRHHPGESVFRFVFTTLAVVITGAPMWIVMMYQSLSVLLSQFNHANITLPSKVNNILSWLIVTPDMHHVHHHYVQPYTDSNYGNIFSIWDHLFGTFSEINPKEIVYGVDTQMNASKNDSITSLLKMPFE